MAIAEQLAATSNADDRVAIWADDSRVTWSQLAKLYRRKLESLAAWEHQRVGLALTPDANGMASLAALQSLQADAFLFDVDTPETKRAQWIDRFSLRALLLPDGQVQASASAKESASSSEGSIRWKRRE